MIRKGPRSLLDLSRIRELSKQSLGDYGNMTGLDLISIMLILPRPFGIVITVNGTEHPLLDAVPYGGIGKKKNSLPAAH